MITRIVKILLAIFAAAALASCEKPVPPERSAYVGNWHGKDMALLITQEGRVIYKRHEDKAERSIKAPLKEFAGDNFIVGLGPMETTFVVSKPPHESDGKWKMTVDGVELIREQ